MRRSERLRPGRAWIAAGRVLLLGGLFGAGAGCDRAEPASESTAATEEGSRSAGVDPGEEGAVAEGSAGAPAPGADPTDDDEKREARERERHLRELLEAGLPEQGGPPVFDGLLAESVVAWGAIDGVDAGVRASRIAGALPHPSGGALVLLALPGPSGRALTWETWHLPGLGDAARRIDRVEIPVAAGAEPSVAALPGRGFLLVRSTDNVEQEGGSVHFLLRRVDLDGSIETESSIVRVPEGVRAYREWTAARAGEHAGLCFLGRASTVPADGEGRFDDVYCGRLTWDGAWERRPRSFFREARGLRGFDVESLRPSGPRLGRSDDGTLMVIFWVAGEGADRFFGVRALPDEGPRGYDLMRESVSTAHPARYRAEPLAVTGARGTAWVVPGMGGSFARGGFLDREGTQVGGLRQVPEYGAWLARPQVTMGPAGAVLLYDDYSLEGFRTFAFWEHQYPESGAMPPPLGGGARERAVHNGWADDALVVLVTSAPDAWVVVASTEPLTRAGVVQRAEGARPAE